MTRVNFFITYHQSVKNITITFLYFDIVASKSFYSTNSKDTYYYCWAVAYDNIAAKNTINRLIFI